MYFVLSKRLHCNRPATSRLHELFRKDFFESLSKINNNSSKSDIHVSAFQEFAKKRSKKIFRFVNIV